MREKIGKDDRVARWPEYETCPRKLDPEFHPTKENVNASLDAELRTASLRTPQKREERQKRPTGVLYQVTAGETPLDEIAACLLLFEERTGGKLPIAIGVRGDETDDYTEITWEKKDGSEINIPIQVVSLSPRYGYIFMITGAA